MRLLLAARLSKARQGQTGIDTQDKDARDWAEKEGHEIIGVAADRISGRVSPFRRKNLGPWLSDPALRAQYDGIVTSKMDRYTRAKDWAIRDWAEKYGKKLIIVQPYLCWPPEKGDTGTPLIWDTLVNLAIAEWENTSLRYKRTMKHLTEQGYLTGKRTYGFRIVPVDGDSDRKTIEVDPSEARFVGQAINLYLGGKSLADVCQWLDANGSVPLSSQKPKEGREPKPWTPQALSYLFRNPSLIGRRVSDATGRTILRHEPLLRLDDGSPDLAKWRRLQTMMDRKATRTAGNASLAMLAGIAVCIKCGAPMYQLKSVTRRPGKPVYVKYYYRCHGFGTQKSTCRNMVPIDELEASVDEHMTDTAPGAHGAERIEKVVIIPGHNYEDQIRDTERDIAELDLDDPLWLDKVTPLREKRAALKALPSVPDKTDKQDAGMTVAEYWPTLDKAGRRAFLLASEAKVRADRDTCLVGTNGNFVLPAES